MNKKLSLMMAAILAAGYSVTAEAGIYKIASPEANGKYVIAVDNYDATKAVLSATANDALSSAPVQTFGDAQLWKVSTASTVGQIESVAYPGYGINATAGIDQSMATFIVANPLKVTAGSSELIITGGTPSMGASGDAYLYAVGTPLFTSTTLNGKYLKINDKYLVATANNAATLVEAAAVPLYGAAALWTATDEGVISNPKTGAQITNITASSVTVAETGGVAIEKDANNNNDNVYLAGTDAAVSGLKPSTIIAADATILATDAEAGTKANNDAISFATDQTSYLGVYVAANTADKYVKIDNKGAVSVVADAATASAASGVTVKEVRKDVYSFYNDGKLVAFANGAAEFKVIFVPGSQKAFYLQSVADESKYLQADLTLGAVNSAAQFCLVVGSQVAITGQELATLEKDGFSMTLKYQDDKGNWLTNLKGNPFVGHLTVEPAVGGNKFELRSGNNYIVAEKGLLEDGTMNDVYKFKTVTKAVLDADKKLRATTSKYISDFSATKSEFETIPTEIVLKLEVPASGSTTSTTIGYYNVLTDVYVGAGARPKPLTFAIGSTTAVKPSELLVKDKFFTIVKIDKKEGNSVLAVKLKEEDPTDSAKGEAAFMKNISNDLEAQWALTVDGTDYVFTNRESKGVTYRMGISTLYHAEGDNNYTSGSVTYNIAPVDNTDAADGYVRLNNVKNTRYNLGYWSNTFNGSAWFTENHKDVKKEQHVIGLDPENDALEFTAVDFTGAKNAQKNIASDSIYVISTLGYYKANGDYATTLDTLKVITYSFINQYNEPLKMGKDEEGQDAYVSNAETQYETLAEAIEAVRNTAGVAQKFALRKDGDKLNLRPVSFAQASGQLYREFSMENDYNKMYSGDAGKGILADTEMYGRLENDLFVIEATEKPMYRTVVNNLDTITIYRNDNDKSILFEKGEFLGMENLAQYPTIAPGMVADLAHNDAEGYHPQYLLMVAPEFVEGGKWCPEHGFNSGCPHEVKVPDYTRGRYLVNLKDTAIAWEKNKEHGMVNPYTNSEKFYKLGFVPAYRLADTLIITSDSSKIQLNNDKYNVAKFSFRYVDNEDKSFVIETADYRKLNDDKVGELLDTYGYLKWMNGVVVVVDDIKDADVYNMDEDYAGKPTANEGIATSEVSVIASNGEVIIKGAAGKKVTISNILGQTIANTVVTSDEATIAAPAGVVVVSVEGEAAVKAIVK